MSASELGEPKSLLTEFEEIRADQLSLCQALEDIADQLGSKPDRLRCVQVARDIEPLLERSATFDQRRLFPVLQDLADKDLSTLQSVDRLKFEQLEDGDVALEVSEALMDFGRGNSRLSQDAIGYLLRGFFVALRRHLAYKTDFLNAVLGE
ncbi:MAG TPA: hypothetical protein ENJ90_05460 [Devosia sp.]|nr:hypothetical protein [Devosia sp.]